MVPEIDWPDFGARAMYKAVLVDIEGEVHLAIGSADENHERVLLTYLNEVLDEEQKERVNRNGDVYRNDIVNLMGAGFVVKKQDASLDSYLAFGGEGISLKSRFTEEAVGVIKSMSPGLDIRYEPLQKLLFDK